MLYNFRLCINKKCCTMYHYKDCCPLRCDASQPDRWCLYLLNYIASHPKQSSVHSHYRGNLKSHVFQWSLGFLKWVIRNADIKLICTVFAQDVIAYHTQNITLCEKPVFPAIKSAKYQIQNFPFIWHEPVIQTLLTERVGAVVKL